MRAATRGVDQMRILASLGNMTTEQSAAWQSPVPLEDNGTYWWRAEICDIHGLEQTTAWTAFTVRTGARQPAESKVSAPEGRPLAIAARTIHGRLHEPGADPSLLRIGNYQG